MRGEGHLPVDLSDQQPIVHYESPNGEFQSCTREDAQIRLRAGVFKPETRFIFAPRGANVRSGEWSVRTLGELIKLNGRSTPFLMSDEERRGREEPKKRLNYEKKEGDRQKQDKMDFWWCDPKDGKVPVDKATQMMSKYGLGRNVLEQIVSLSDTDDDGHLDEREFVIAMKLARNCVNGIPLPLSLSPSQLNVPILRMDEDAPALTVSGKELDNWTMPEQNKLKYSILFVEKKRKAEPFLDGPTARNVLGQSGLPIHALAHVWTLSDVNKDGRLSKEEFSIAMWLTDQHKTGFALPAELPPELAAMTHDGSARSDSPATPSGEAPAQKLSTPNTFEDLYNRCLLILIGRTALTEKDCKDKLLCYGAIKQIRFASNNRVAFVDFACEHAPLLVARCFLLHKSNPDVPMPKGVTTLLPGCSMENKLYLQHVPRALSNYGLRRFFSGHEIIIHRPIVGSPPHLSSKVLIELNGVPASVYTKDGVTLHDAFEGNTRHQFYAIPHIEQLTNSKNVCEGGGCSQCQVKLLRNNIYAEERNAARTSQVTPREPDYRIDRSEAPRVSQKSRSLTRRAPSRTSNGRESVNEDRETPTTSDLIVGSAEQYEYLASFSQSPAPLRGYAPQLQQAQKQERREHPFAKMQFSRPVTPLTSPTPQPQTEQRREDVKENPFGRPQFTRPDSHTPSPAPLPPPPQPQIEQRREEVKEHPFSSMQFSRPTSSSPSPAAVPAPLQPQIEQRGEETKEHPFSHIQFSRPSSSSPSPASFTVLPQSQVEQRREETKEHTFSRIQFSRPASLTPSPAPVPAPPQPQIEQRREETKEHLFSHMQFSRPPSLTPSPAPLPTVPPFPTVPTVPVHPQLAQRREETKTHSFSHMQFSWPTPRFSQSSARGARTNASDAQESATPNTRVEEREGASTTLQPEKEEIQKDSHSHSGDYVPRASQSSASTARATACEAREGAREERVSPTPSASQEERAGVSTTRQKRINENRTPLQRISDSDESADYASIRTGETREIPQGDVHTVSESGERKEADGSFVSRGLYWRRSSEEPDSDDESIEEGEQRDSGHFNFSSASLEDKPSEEVEEKKEVRQRVAVSSQSFNDEVTRDDELKPEIVEEERKEIEGGVPATEQTVLSSVDSCLSLFRRSTVVDSDDESVGVEEEEKEEERVEEGEQRGVYPSSKMRRWSRTNVEDQDEEEYQSSEYHSWLTREYGREAVRGDSLDHHSSESDAEIVPLPSSLPWSTWGKGIVVEETTTVDPTVLPEDNIDSQ